MDLVKLITMKIKITLSLFSIVLCAGTSFAQLSVGAKVGANINKFEDTARRLGYSAGGYASYDILDFLTLRAEVQYLSYAAGLDSYDESFEGYSVTHENRNLRMHTIEIPAMVHIKLPFKEDNAPTFYAGYAYGYTLAAFLIEDRTYSFEQATQDSPPLDTVEPATDDYTFKNRYTNITSSINKFNSSILFGFTYTFDAGMPITINLRYQRGLIEMNNIGSFNSPGNPGSLMNRMYSISLSTKLF